MGPLRCVFLLVSVACMGDAAKILGIFNMPAPSHFILGERLMKELAGRGHEVTMVSHFPQKTRIPNYKDISLIVEGEKKHDFNLFDMESMSSFGQIIFTHMLGSAVAEKSINHPNVQKLFKSDEKFDLVITEQFMNEIYIGFAHRYNCPFIILSTMGSNSWTNGLVSNPAPYAYIPDLMLQYSSTMNFWQRLHNVYFGAFYQLYRELYYFPKQDKLLHTHFKEAPPLMELMRNNLSMILLNSHPITADPQPHLPSMVEIGGFHVRDPKPLPKDLQEYMDSAKDGVIIFSMGSNLKSANLPVDKRDAILKTFAKLKQQVLWKWEDDVLPGQPPNVKLSKWMPQNDIMAHPNLKAFLTHGGLLSTTEALYHGIPIVGIPIFGDQKMNIAHAVQKKYGLAVSYDELTEEKLTHALNEILHNPIYRQNIREKSKILRDQPMKPIDSAMFWIEHVIRHKGAKHFRCAAQDLYWFQLYLVDVLAFTFVIGLVIFLVFTSLLKCLCRKKPVKKDTKKKKN